MDYEKRYNDALERASKLRVQNPFDTVSQMMEHVFPELKESEDERLRKTTIAFLKEYADKGYENAVECIDWLEKQCQTFTKKDADTQSNGIWHTADETPVGSSDKQILVLFKDSDAMVVPVEDWESLDKQLKWAYINDLIKISL